MDKQPDPVSIAASAVADELTRQTLGWMDGEYPGWEVRDPGMVEAAKRLPSDVVLNLDSYETVQMMFFLVGRRLKG